MNIAIIGKSKGLPHFTEMIQNSDLRISQADVNDYREIYNKEENLSFLQRCIDKVNSATTQEMEDVFFNSAKSMFLRYAKQQHESVSNIAKRELENIENNINSVCENNDLEQFRTFPKKVQIAVLVSIMTDYKEIQWNG